jgi:hypothetical protein
MEIEEDGFLSHRPMKGADGFEALFAALFVTGIDLGCIQQYAGSMSWLGGKRSGLGFPTHPDFSLRAIDSPESYQ